MCMLFHYYMRGTHHRTNAFLSTSFCPLEVTPFEFTGIWEFLFLGSCRPGFFSKKVLELVHVKKGKKEQDYTTLSVRVRANT